MSGERALARLLAGMRPELRPGIHLFCTVSLEDPRIATASGLAVATFREDEGLTLVLRDEDVVRLGLEGEFRCRRITLAVASDLAAVGFLARVATALAERGIPANAIAAFHHDHLFVPEADAERAMATLRELSRSAESPA